MNHRAIGTGIALIALLSSGCGLCNGVQRAWYFATTTDYNRTTPRVPPEPPKEPIASESPVPGNALASIAGNEFHPWTGPFIHMPLKTEQPEAP